MPDQFLVHQGVTHSDEGHRPTISVNSHRLHIHYLGEDEGGGRLLGLGPEVLILLRAVDAPEAYLLGLPVVEENRWFASVEVNAAAGSGGSN